MTNGAITEQERQERYIRDLLEELAGCERLGRTERAKAIRAELGQKAAEAAAPARRSERRPAAPEAESR